MFHACSICEEVTPLDQAPSSSPSRFGSVGLPRLTTQFLPPFRAPLPFSVVYVYFLAWRDSVWSIGEPHLCERPHLLVRNPVFPPFLFLVMWGPTATPFEALFSTPHTPLDSPLFLGDLVLDPFLQLYAPFFLCPLPLYHASANHHLSQGFDGAILAFEFPWVFCAPPITAHFGPSSTFTPSYVRFFAE